MSPDIYRTAARFLRKRSPSRHWALYADNLRMGTYREHRLAGARLRAVGVSLEFSLPRGWRATVYVPRFSVEATWKVADGDPRLRDWWDFVMPPTAVADLAQSRADLDAGRGYRWDPRATDDRHVPLATWRADDPVQPEGWHHDGRHWVLNENGWTRDRTGSWHYAVSP